MEDSSPRSQDHAKLLDYGLDPKVADKLDSIFETGKLSHADLDQRALDALKEFHVDGALTVLNQFVESNLEHVANKSAFLCGVMKTYRQKSRAGVLHDNNGAMSPPPPRGPDQDKIKGILERTGYSLDVTTGQRKYGGPPPDWTGSPPGPGCEVFCGKIPKQLFEDDLIPVFEKCGTLWDLRLMMDPMSGLNRGFAFVTYTTKAEARLAVQELDGYTILERRKIKVNISIPNTRIFVGNIPKSKTQEDIHEAFSSLSAGLVEVIIYSSPNDKKRNRGFCFLEYESHKSASLAKRRLETGRVKVWNCDIIVDWADPQEEPDEETMAKVKVLYCRNLSVDVTEEDLRERFEAYGNIERVKKIKDYAFIHMEAREQAIQAMNALNGLEMEGMALQISLAKPPSDKKKKEDMLRRREDRMMQAMAKSMSMSPFPAMFPPYAAMPGMFSPHGPPTRRHPMSPGGMRGGGAGPSRGGGWANDVGPWGDAGNWGGRGGGGWWQDKRDGGYGGARGGDYGGARGGDGGYGASRGGAGSRD